MKLKKTLFFFVCCLTITVTAQAKIIDDVIAPVTNDDARAVLIIGSTITLTTALFKSSLVKNTQRELQESQPLCCKITKSGNKFLQILPNGIYVLSFGIHSLLSDSETSKERAIGMTKATLYSGLFTDILKPLINEERPNGGKHSFPSGHTTTAFAFASFVAAEHPWYFGAPAYVVATFVGFCRMHDNFHYLHDVMAGATIGMSYGIAMAEKARGNDTSTAFVIVPSEKLDGLQFNLARAF
jgi:membrane-associated phospholipid phosphatase